MSIKFPDFSDTRCLVLSACGFLEADEKDLPDFIKKEEVTELIAPYKSGRTTAFIRVLLGGRSAKHVHIDAYKKEAYERKSPKARSKRKDIEEILEPFSGMRITTSSRARFLVPATELPDPGLLRSTFMKSREDEVSILVSGVQFAISGSPIEGLSWRFTGEGESVGVEVDATKTTELGKDYLIEQMKLLESGFRFFALGEVSKWE